MISVIVDPHKPKLIVYTSFNNLIILPTTLELSFNFQACIK